MTSRSSLMRLEHMSCSYGSASPVVEAVELSIGADDFIGIVGPSGSGKTTVLRAMLGTVRPVFGAVHRRRGLRVAYVPQTETVNWTFPVTVREVLSMSRAGDSWRPWTSRGERRLVADMLERLGLAGLGGRHIGELSGGQQQRVFLARAMLRHPDLLVLDEPTAGVDVRTRHEILHVLTDLNAEGVAIVLTTHDLNGLATHLPRLVCFNRTVVADGPPIAVLHPYVLERTFGAPMAVLEHGGLLVVVDSGIDAAGHPSDQRAEPRPSISRSRSAHPRTAIGGESRGVPPGQG